jgi:hypothetical protein
MKHNKLTAPPAYVFDATQAGRVYDAEELNEYNKS